MSEQLWVLCEHGEAKAHSVVLKRSEHLGIPEYQTCPGGHPVEGGEKVWWCTQHGERAYVSAIRGVKDPHCWVRDMGPQPCVVVERFLIPPPNSETTND